MSHIANHRAVPVLVVMTALAVSLVIGCSDPNLQSGFDPETGRHISSWYVDHRSVYLSSCTTCGDCHGENLQGGMSQVSCNSTTLNGISCHPSGQFVGHPLPWAAASLHGPVAKASPGTCSGFSYCQRCHGNTFAGIPPADSCLASCHGVSAPHPSQSHWQPTVSVPTTHRNTNEGNAPVCYQCHHKAVTTSPGCFNNTLCHSGD
jgi:hypothetical protein